jgi:hypothetical protein
MLSKLSVSFLMVVNTDNCSRNTQWETSVMSFFSEMSRRVTLSYQSSEIGRRRFNSWKGRWGMGAPWVMPVLVWPGTVMMFSAAVRMRSVGWSIEKLLPSPQRYRDKIPCPLNGPTFNATVIHMHSSSIYISDLHTRQCHRRMATERATSVNQTSGNRENY